MSGRVRVLCSKKLFDPSLRLPWPKTGRRQKRLSRFPAEPSLGRYKNPRYLFSFFFFTRDECVRSKTRTKP